MRRARAGGVFFAQYGCPPVDTQNGRWGVGRASHPNASRMVCRAAFAGYLPGDFSLTAALSATFSGVLGSARSERVRGR